jgi:hydrogenase nickel incorporation protein HypA/HybF
MHELSICQSLLEEVASQVEQNGGGQVRSIMIEIGPLSGVEPHLLQAAFSLARLGTVAEHATLTVQTIPVCIRCPSCQSEHETDPNDLRCPSCGEWRTRLIRGDEMMLRRMEIEQV